MSLWLLARFSMRNWWPLRRSERVERGMLNRRAISRIELISPFLKASIANKMRPSCSCEFRFDRERFGGMVGG